MSEEEFDNYGDEQIRSGHAPIPGWLKWSYVLLPIWGVIWFYLFWNGMGGWFDRGHWLQLQKAAETTFPDQ